MITFDKAMYNHGNKGPSKQGFQLSVSTNQKDWFNYREYLLCNGFTIRGQMFKEDFCFQVIDSNTYKFTLSNSMDNTKKEYVADNPLKLLKMVYPNKSLSANAMLVFGAPAVQKIAAVLSDKPCASNYSEMYNDKYYSEARKTLLDFLEDFKNNDLQERYIMNGDWSWDKKTNQKRCLNTKTSNTKTSNIKTSNTKTKTSNNDIYDDFLNEILEYDDVFSSKKRKRKTSENDINENMNENEMNENMNENENEMNENNAPLKKVHSDQMNVHPMNDLSKFVWTFDINDDQSFKPIDPELEALFENK